MKKALFKVLVLITILFSLYSISTGTVPCYTCKKTHDYNHDTKVWCIGPNGEFFTHDWCTGIGRNGHWGIEESGCYYAGDFLVCDECNV